MEGSPLDLPGVLPAFPLARALGETLSHTAQDGSGPHLLSARAALATAGIGPSPFDTPSPSREGTIADQIKIIDALTIVLPSLAQGPPLVLRLDDMQWASPFTWDAVRYCVRALRTAPMLFLRPLATRFCARRLAPVLSRSPSLCDCGCSPTCRSARSMQQRSPGRL